MKENERKRERWSGTKKDKTKNGRCWCHPVAHTNLWIEVILENLGTIRAGSSRRSSGSTVIHWWRTVNNLARHSSLLFQFVPGPLDHMAVFLVVCPVKGIPSLAFWRVVAFSFYTAKSNFSPPPTLQDLRTGSNVHCALRFSFSVLVSRIYRFTTLVLMFPRGTDHSGSLVLRRFLIFLIQNNLFARYSLYNFWFYSTLILYRHSYIRFSWHFLLVSGNWHRRTSRRTRLHLLLIVVSRLPWVSVILYNNDRSIQNNNPDPVIITFRPLASS